MMISGSRTAASGSGSTKPWLTSGSISCTNRPPATASTTIATVATASSGQ
jgi:hypothetical protein